ncbi:cysteine and histidine-rich domain-containing protein [Contarinia nasturtii]|uniref:cysteine and histidine-rich domain-containing protein n=1 Tax=Contarinia nasturtii TaxID=265458 RepID=UPI0012D455D7|nr:cysteine and histidine-rich domain-containing protein [Contarinia nasturtii]
MISCYNRGCGQNFDPENNPDDACRHHPGMPFFHDAYKGWSCCNKKSVDFTEFLSIKGCQLSKHSNIKPIEPEKAAPKLIEDEPEPVKMPEPVKPSALERPSFDTELVTLTPIIAPALKKSIDDLVIGNTKKSTLNLSDEIAIGTACKNAGCGKTYESPSSDNTECVHHPGQAIFHEGLKYWSCCTKRTTDFAAFMEQKGCAYGKHKWTADQNEEVKCRYDWHQTASNIVIAIYAKMYHYDKSFIKVNPIRLNVCLVFPQQNDAEFKLDLELRGIISVPKATVQMFGTKVEITMPKAEPGHWITLDIPDKTKNANTIVNKSTEPVNTTKDNDDDSDLDLDDIQQVRGVRITEN